MLQHIPESFLTGDRPFMRLATLKQSPQRVDHHLVFEPHHEGFIGIPHGGLAMGLCLDAWRRIGVPEYPVHVRFRFAGSGLAIGEQSTFRVEVNAGNGAIVTTEISKAGDKRPYLRAEVEPADPATLGSGILEAPDSEHRFLPYYSNCFVCGHHRTAPGLRRRFRVHDENHAPVTTVEWNSSPEDREAAEFFLIGHEEIHPTVLIAIFDENTAWSGFMQTGGAGLSVKLEFTLLRPVEKWERLLFIGRPTGIRGNPRAPRFFLAEGSILSMAEPASPQVVAHGKGEWIIMEQYTRQIRDNLLPRDDWRWIFPEK